jgi:hypothetical protein
MEITTIQRAEARSSMSAFGPAASGTAVPKYAALAAVAVTPREHSDAGNGGVGALDAWGPPV